MTAPECTIRCNQCHHCFEDDVELYWAKDVTGELWVKVCPFCHSDEYLHDIATEESVGWTYYEDD